MFLKTFAVLIRKKTLYLILIENLLQSFEMIAL